MGGEHVATMQILPDGTPRLYDEDPQTVARIRAIERAATDVAASFTVAPDRSLGDDPIAQTLVADQVAPPAAAAVAALLVARARRLPLYSDDRVLRAFARTFGVPAFGTMALVDAAQRRSMLAQTESIELRDAIVDLGVWSLALEPQLYATTPAE